MKQDVPSFHGQTTERQWRNARVRRVLLADGRHIREPPHFPDFTVFKTKNRLIRQENVPYLGQFSVRSIRKKYLGTKSPTGLQIGYLYTRYPIVARALGLAFVQPLGRVRARAKVSYIKIGYKRAPKKWRPFLKTLSFCGAPKK